MERFRRCFMVLSVVVLFVAGFSSGAALSAEYKTADDFVQAATAEIKEVSVAEAHDMIAGGKSLVILDVREQGEFKKGHIPGAINISRGVLEFKVAKEILNRDAAILVYCKVGGRGALAAYTLKQMGYKNILNMAGGWDKWLGAGYSVE